ncbi:MAG: hypothetical protein HYY12_01925 [Candidatus Methylomirabilis oxyfera]|nr:hypothetical protein [Candidatus Methylomirabilis oxyfera]
MLLNARAAVTRQPLASLVILFLCLFPMRAAAAGANSELVPGSRIVFPYYDLRPGSATFLIFTNVGPESTSVRMEFYDMTCIRRDSSISLSAGDVDLLDLSSALPSEPSGTFQQGFVDAVANDDVLMGTALIVNVTQDWAILYHGAAARRRVGAVTPFEPYPSRLFLPAFLTPGSLGEAGFTDGLLVLAAPHPTQPGGELPAQPIQASFEIFLKTGSTRDSGGFQDFAEVTNAVSGGASGHQVILPIGQITGSLPPPTLGWLSVANSVVDDSGIPFGLVGLYLQTVVRPEGGMAMAIRLWGDPTEVPGP